LGLAAGCGQPPAPASSPISYYKKKTRVYKGSSAMPQSTRKRLNSAAYCASPEQRLSAEQKGKFWVRAKFAFLPISPKNLNASKQQGGKLGKNKDYRQTTALFILLLQFYNFFPKFVNYTSLVNFKKIEYAM
jgi:hypothetical protein